MCRESIQCNLSELIQTLLLVLIPTTTHMMSNMLVLDESAIVFGKTRKIPKVYQSIKECIDPPVLLNVDQYLEFKSAEIKS